MTLPGDGKGSPEHLVLRPAREPVLPFADFADKIFGLFWILS
jgi:hypothetical protein